MNGSGQRKCQSWIDRFVEHTDNLESPEIFRRWAAITTIAATLEQKVWTTAGSPLYPNLYIFLVGLAGIGKSRAITASTGYIAEIPELFLGPTSPTMASLVDHLAESERTITIYYPKEEQIKYNTIYIVADEITAFMADYDAELVGGLTTFYDVVPYSQSRRTKELRIKMKSPQVTLLFGATPSSIMKLVKDWEQGFTSRFIMIYSDDKPNIDIFSTPNKPKSQDLIHDLQVINALQGQMGWTEGWAKAMNDWKQLGLPPVPTHPKLASYCARRFSHIQKLSMIACVDRGNDMMLSVIDFNRAMGWLIEAEATMPEVFRLGSTSVDSKAMDEIAYYVESLGKVSEQRIVNFARDRVPAVQIKGLIEMMEKSGMIKSPGFDVKTGIKYWTR